MKLTVGEIEKPVTRNMTGNEAAARILLQQMLESGSKDAITIILERIEGKATRAAPNKSTNQHLDEQVDLQLDMLNKFTEDNTK